MRARRFALGALAICALGAAPARAQDRPRAMPIAAESADSILRVTIEAFRARPLDLDNLRGRFAAPRAPVARPPIAPLDPVSLLRLRSAVRLREQGQLATARDSLRRLLDQAPHHPLVVTELGRTLLELEDHGALERLARAEREARKDSLLLGHELAEALERLGKPTEAALTAIELWAAAPIEAEWASATLARLTPADLSRTRPALRRAVAREPQRGDLARALARLEWRAGDTAAMLRALEAADRSGSHGNARWAFAEELLRGGAASDTVGALEALLAMAGDPGLPVALRNVAAGRAWEVELAHGAPGAGSARIAKALAGTPADQWDASLALAVARALRESGHTAEARALLDSGGGHAAPGDLALERALTDLRDGPPARALPVLKIAAAGSEDGAFQYAEALFFDGQCDSARGAYQKIAEDPHGGRTGAALERLFLIEDADPKSALTAFGRAAYAEWRGNTREAAAIAESLFAALPRGALWAQTAILLARQRDAAGEPRAALEPLLALADSLSEDRLAPLARQRAGDLYRDRLHDDAHAAEQYEECLIRYPRAWNAPEVRRSLERLRRERRL
ncbi:MAG: hypothetical protein HYR73_00180 [Candidatus Eisenbacteria bacterium]|nr:hypothetical protein [Candidatus Eisenbacteria bacterium]